MKRVSKIAPYAVLLLGLAYGAVAEASHFRYGTLSWVPTDQPGEVRFTLTAAWRRSGYGGSGTDGRAVTGDIIFESIGATRFQFGDLGSTPTLRFLITAHSAAEDWVIGVALNPGTNNPGILKTYSGDGPFNALMSGCCRVGSGLLNNRAGGRYSLRTVVELSIPNRSPVSTMSPVVLVPEGTNVSFLVPAADPDLDALNWRISTDTEAGGGASPPNISIDSTTGLLTWNNVGLNQTRFWTVQVMIDDLKTSIPVDFMMKIVPQVGSPPTIAIDPPGPFVVSAGQTVSFDVIGNDPDQDDQVTLNSAGLPPGGSMTPGLPFSGLAPVVSTFNWTPAVADQGNTYVVLFNATDLFGNQVSTSVTIDVISNTPPVAIASVVVSGEDLGDLAEIPCVDHHGTTITLDGSGSYDPDGDDLEFEWTVAAGSGITIDDPTAEITNAQFPIGVHEVTLTVYDLDEHGDRKGELGMTSVTVIIFDETPPVALVTTDLSALWAPNNKMVLVEITVLASEHCTAPDDLLIYCQVTSSQPDDSHGSGAHVGDVNGEDGYTAPVEVELQNLGDGQYGTLIFLRAERDGEDKAGRVYSINIEAVDLSGNVGIASTTVVVPHNQGIGRGAN